MKTQEQQRRYDIIDVCLLAGKIMLQSGAETYRVEDTMARIAASFGIKYSESYVTPTGIIFSTGGPEPTKLVRIMSRTTDLHKVTIVNSISRRISSGELTVDEAHEQLQEVDRSNEAFPVWLQIVSAAIASGCFLIMFLGGWNDFIPACIAGGVGFIVSAYINRVIEIKFFAEFSAALVIGLLAQLFVVSGLGHELDKIIIGSVMPLVPGLLITNAVRDLMAGHLVSGISKGAEAFLTATAIGGGISMVILLF
ncbi:threonine/serine exporter family protein [Bacillus pinisoli]|uniref:threonine/serine exporter family protein n=1 Tax=Bacillus pinisoli TaxID=2901866 RepID=UPI00300DE745